MQQLENEAAKIRAASWDDLKEGSTLREVTPNCRDALPDAKLEIHIEDLDEANLSAKTHSYHSWMEKGLSSRFDAAVFGAMEVSKSMNGTVLKNHRRGFT